MKKKKNKLIIVGVVVIIFLCLGIFCLVNDSINKLNSKASSNDELGKSLYYKVTYGRFFDNYLTSNTKVTIDSFKNEEKFVYATQNLYADDYKEITTNTDGKKVYFVTKEAMSKALKKLFGDSVKYDEITSFKAFINVNQDLSGIATYQQTTNGYNVIINEINEETLKLKYFSTYEKMTETNKKVKVYEKIAYVKYDSKTEAMKVYKDFNHKHIIKTTDSKKPQSSNYYLKRGGCIVYTFSKDKEGNYYFISSEVIS